MIIGGEFFSDREIPREPEVIERSKKLVGAGPLPAPFMRVAESKTWPDLSWKPAEA